jgi:arginase
MNDFLRVFFPQWQGGGDKAMNTAAHTLRKLLGDNWGEEVAVTMHDSSTLQRIHQYSALREQHQRVTNLLKMRQPEKIFTLGGDCNAAIAPVNTLSQHYGGDLTLIWFDQHADLNTPASSPSGNFHGMPVRHILGEGERTLFGQLGAPLLPARIVYVGAGDFDPDERATIAKHHMTVLGVHEVTQDPTLLARVLQKKGTERAYIHIDTDIFDAREFNGTGYPNKAGLFLDELTALLTVADQTVSIVGATLTHYNTTDPTQLATLQKVVGLVEGMMGGLT